MARVRISNDSLNSYGTRVLTSGMDLDQYRRNPVLLYMHRRGEVIGYVKDLKVEDDAVTGELVFDEASDLSRRCKQQWEFGSLKMVSAGVDIIEMSDDPKHLVQGQTAPTITKSKLFEVSVVDIGANDDALRLRKDGRHIDLSKDGGTLLPLLHNNSINHQKETEMDVKKLALELGLKEDATEEAVAAELVKLKKESADAESLRKELDELKAQRIDDIVEKAVAEKKIGKERKQQFLALGAKIGAADLEQTFAAMTPQVKLSAIVGGGHGGGSDWKKLSDVPAAELAEMREKDPQQYKTLYKAEYGMECEV